MNFMKISLLFFALFLFVPEAFAGPTKPTVEDLSRELHQTWNVIRAPEFSEEMKSAQISRFFHTFDETCRQSCYETAQWLTQKGSETLPGLKQVAFDLTEDHFLKSLGLNAELQATAKTVRLPVAQLSELSKKLEAYLKKNPEDFYYKLSASLEALRFLVALEERALFQVLQSDPTGRSEGVEKIKRDLLFFYKQGKAIKNIMGLLSLEDGEPRDSISPAKMREIVKNISSLGVFYIKLAQTLSNMDFLLPSGVSESLSVFQDRVPPMSTKEVLEIMTRELGRDPREIFIDFDPEKPIASGSIAVTYKAKIKEWGRVRSVIIKVQRPGLLEELEFNKKFNQFLMKSLAVFTTEKTAPIINFITDQVMGLELAFEGELNFLGQEVKNLKKYRRFFWLHFNIVVPKVFDKYTTKSIITMEEIDGANLRKSLASGTSLAEMFDEPGQFTQEQKNRQKGIEKTFSSLLETTLYMIFVLKELHADLHTGNIVEKMFDDIEKEGTTSKLGLVDFAQTVKTKGLISYPLKAAYYFAMGNSLGVAKQMVLMSKNPQEPPEKLQKLIQEVFEKWKIESRTPSDFLNNEISRKILDDFSEVFSEILKRASYELKYQGSARYTQALRTLAPVSGSLVELSKEIDPQRMRRLLATSFLRGVVLGWFRYSALKIPAMVGEYKDNWFLNKKASSAEKKSSQTTAPLCGSRLKPN
ncbi:MAG: AarF/UbiB family protein [Bdellovibrionales bacterium]